MRAKEIEKKYVYERDLGICFICGKPVKRNKMTLDHYYPKSMGGSTEVFNLVCCCKQCNRLKRSQVPKDWEAVNIALFQRAIFDRRLNLSRLVQTPAEVYTLSQKVNAIIRTRYNVIFEAPGIRFYVNDGNISKIVYFDVREEPLDFVL
ncbi:MAG: hypothetical protein PWP51_858 [Clostridiales bacterium]|nr:hypothetical protein [Clostridiales bacterium]MDN5298305.1 hypothetical protein [Clostridiales bacterium]